MTISLHFTLYTADGQGIISCGGFRVEITKKSHRRDDQVLYCYLDGRSYGNLKQIRGRYTFDDPEALLRYTARMPWLPTAQPDAPGLDAMLTALRESGWELAEAGESND